MQTTPLAFTMSNQSSDLACMLASLILADSKHEITQESIKKIVAAAGVSNLDEKWPILFAKFLQGKDVMSLLTAVNVSGGGDCGCAGGAEAAAGGAAEEKKKEESEEEIVAGFGFDDDSD